MMSALLVWLALAFGSLSPTVYLPLVQMDAWRLGRGVGMPYPSCADAQQLGVAWLYDWGPYPPDCGEVQALPMLWSWSATTLCPLLGAGNPVLLFNEPEQVGQANLTPEQAARYMRQIVDCYPRRTFTTPATVNDSTFAWLNAWWVAYETLYGISPPVRYMATHCYELAAWRHCQSYLRSAQAWAHAHGLAGVLVTEWAVLPCDGNVAAALALAAEMRVWMAGQADILGHAWFASRIHGDEPWSFQPRACNTSLLDEAGLTPFGAWFVR